MKKYYLIIDQGTTSSRSIIYDKEFNLIDKVSIMLTQSYPKKDWVEHDPIEIWNSQKSTMQQVLIKNNISIDEIISIGISNQRETVVAWDKDTGLPIYNAIVWQDSRTSDYCKIIDKKYHDLIKEKTGLCVNAYFSASKIKWILDNVPKAKELLKHNKLMVGTVDSWLLYKLTEHQCFKTDHTNASRTMLFNIDKLCWDDELLDIFKIPKNILADVYPSSNLYAYMNNSVISSQSKNKTPICAIAGDQQASLFGQQCFSKGDTKSTFGTGCFIIMNTDNLRINSKHNLLTTISCSISNDVQYALEGSVFNAGTVIEWLSNDLKVLYNPQEADWYSELALTNNQKDLFFVPAFTGLGAPYWDPNARGMIIGIERSTRREHIIKAAIEGIAFQVNDVINSMLSEHENLKLNTLKVDGGLSQCDFLNQFLASLLHMDVYKTKNHESSSLGIAYLCAINLKLINKEKMKKQEIITFKPIYEKELVDGMYSNWIKAVNKTLNWKETNEKETES